MSAPKTRNAWGMMGKPEAVYGTGETLAGATEGLLLSELPTVDFSEYLWDGDRGITPAGAPNVRSARGGLAGKMTLPALIMGAGAAYSAGVKPPLDTLLRGCGLESVFSTNKYYYNPEMGPTGLDGLTLEAYLTGQKYRMVGSYGDFSLVAEGPGPIKASFEMQGIADEPVDAAIPAITYPTFTLLPPNNVNIALTLGSFTGGIVRGWEFHLNRSHDTKRTNLNGASNPHSGFTPGARNPQLIVTVERCTLTTADPWSAAGTLNPYQLRNTGKLIIASLAVGSAANNRMKLWSGPNAAAAAQAQVVAVEDAEDGPTGLWKITLELKPSGYGLQDDFTITFD